MHTPSLSGRPKTKENRRAWHQREAKGSRKYCFRMPREPRAIMCLIAEVEASAASETNHLTRTRPTNQNMSCIMKKEPEIHIIGDLCTEVRSDAEISSGKTRLARGHETETRRLRSDISPESSLRAVLRRLTKIRARQQANLKQMAKQSSGNLLLKGIL